MTFPYIIVPPETPLYQSKLTKDIILTPNASSPSVFTPSTPSQSIAKVTVAALTGKTYMCVRMDFHMVGAFEAPCNARAVFQILFDGSLVGETVVSAGAYVYNAVSTSFCDISGSKDGTISHSVEVIGHMESDQASGCFRLEPLSYAHHRAVLLAHAYPW